MKTTRITQFKKAFAVLSSLLLMQAGLGQVITKTPNSMKKKILFVVTSHDQKGNTGEATGFYLSEVTHPWDVLVNAGYEIDLVSPKGGKAPVDGLNLGDPINKKFWENKEYRYKVENTKKPGQINPNDYAAIHYAGGHGAMWDLPENTELANIAAKIYESNGIVSAVCHGPAALVNIRLSNGNYLVDGKKINAFTNEEELAVKLEKVVPFLLETKLTERGGIFEKSGLWQSHVANDQRLITGQNPQSAKEVGEAVLKELLNKEVSGRLVRYEVSPAYQPQFKELLGQYVMNALNNEANMMAEACYEQQDSSVIWLIERWKSAEDLNRFTAQHSQAITALSKQVLKKKPETYLVNDLEPLSKKEWRRVAKTEDHPLTIMLFVDSKKGTEENFKSIYHTAMPQFRSEPGVVTYQLSQVQGDGTKFVTFEKFRNEAAFNYHLDFPPVKPVIGYLETSIKEQPFQKGLHQLIELAPLTRE